MTAPTTPRRPSLTAMCRAFEAVNAAAMKRQAGGR